MAGLYETGYNQYNQYSGGVLDIQHTGHVVQIQEEGKDYIGNDILDDYYHMKFTLGILILTIIVIIKFYQKVFKKKI